MNALRDAANDRHYTCCEPDCTYAVAFHIPKKWCEWHWHLWFAHGDERVAQEYLREHRALRSPEDILKDGPQRPVDHPIALVREACTNTNNS